MKRFLFVLVLLSFVCVAYGQESTTQPKETPAAVAPAPVAAPAEVKVVVPVAPAVPVSPAATVAAESKEITTVTPWYLGEAFIGLVAAVIAGIFGIVKIWIAKKNAKWAKIVELAEGVVTKIYTEQVRELKKLAADGKLSKEDIAKLQTAAWEQIKAAGKEKGIEIAKFVADEYAPVLISKIVERMKGGELSPPTK